MIVSIMTWNTGLTEGTDSNKVLEYIKSFVDKENTIAVLQQIPYKEPNNNWNISPAYKDFINTFPEDVYNVFWEKNTAIMYTVFPTCMIILIVSLY